MIKMIFLFLCSSSLCFAGQETDYYGSWETSQQENGIKWRVLVSPSSGYAKELTDAKAIQDVAQQTIIKEHIVDLELQKTKAAELGYDDVVASKNSEIINNAKELEKLTKK